MFYFERHMYNYSLNGEWALVSPILENKTIILGGREYVASKFEAPSHTRMAPFFKLP